MSDAKVPWSGVLQTVQPRIRLTRSFDQRSHTYQGFTLRIKGKLGSEQREFLVGIGEAAQAKHQFRAGDYGEGLGEASELPSRSQNVDFGSPVAGSSSYSPRG